VSSVVTVGQTLNFGLYVYNTAGALADLGGGDPTATVTLPDGTTEVASVTKTATGTYAAALVTTQAGRHLCTWTGTGDNSGGLPYRDVAEVAPADPRLIVSLADARDALNIASSATESDDEIRVYIRAATEVIEDLVGPVLEASITEKHTGGGWAIGLHRRAEAITSVTEDGTALSASDYSLDAASSILWRGTYPGAARWAAATTTGITVVYTVGRSTVDPNVRLAARELIRHLYAVGQQPWRQPYGGGLDDVSMTVTPTGHAVPHRVVQLLGPSMARRMPGIA